MIPTGRRSWLFMGSDDHAQAAANIFSLVASCKLHQLDVETYLAENHPRHAVLAPRPVPRARPEVLGAATRARLDPSELELPLGPVTVPPPAPRSSSRRGSIAASTHASLRQPAGAVENAGSCSG